MLLNLKEFFNVLLSARILLPFMMLVMVSASPSLFDLSKYILINIGKPPLKNVTNSLGGWSVFDISLNQLLYGLLYTVLFFCYLNYLPAQRYDYTMFIGTITWSGFLFFQLLLPLMTVDTPFALVFTLRFIQLLLGNISGDFLMATMVGKVSKKLPEGFESFGVVFVISSANLSGNIANYGDLWEIQKFDIKKGYYDLNRVGYAALINYSYSVFLVFISWILLRWKK